MLLHTPKFDDLIGGFQYDFSKWFTFWTTLDLHLVLSSAPYRRPTCICSSAGWLYT